MNSRFPSSTKDKLSLGSILIAVPCNKESKAVKSQGTVDLNIDWQNPLKLPPQEKSKSNLTETNP